jgi:HEAT repeat protein
MRGWVGAGLADGGFVMRSLLLVVAGLVLTANLRSEEPSVRQGPRTIAQPGLPRPLSETDLLLADDDQLLVWLYARSVSQKDPLNLTVLIPQLGSSEFAEREDASARLVALGRMALPDLHAAENDKDPEIANRVRGCVSTIEAAPKEVTSGAVIHRVLQRQPKGGIAALIRYLPFAADQGDIEAIYFGVSNWVEREGKIDPKLVEALRDSMPVRRALAGCLVGKTGDAHDRAAVVRLLTDADVEVRLRAAQGLLAAGDKASILPLCNLLTESRIDIAWQAEELLRYAAGEKSPGNLLGKGTVTERARCKAAWEKWWKDEGTNIDLGTIKENGRRPGLILAVEDAKGTATWIDGQDPRELAKGRPWEGHIWLCGYDGQPRYEACTVDELKKILDANTIARQAFGQGRRLLKLKLASTLPYERGDDGGMSEFYCVARLESGVRFLGRQATTFHGIHRLLEVDTAGRTVWDAAFENLVDGILICPLLRVGFERPVGEKANLDLSAERRLRFQHRDHLVRRLAWDILRASGPERALFQAAVPALRDEDTGVRRHAVEVVAQSGEEASAVIPQLLRLLDDPDPEISNSAEIALHNCGEDAIPALVAIYRQPVGKDTSNRRAIASRLLSRLVTSDDHRVHETLKLAFQDKDAQVRMQLLNGLATQREKAKRYYRQIVQAQKDLDPEVAAYAHYAFCKLGDAGAEAVPELLKMLERQETRPGAIFDLAAVGRHHPMVLPALLKCLEKHKDADTCIALAGAFAKFDGKDVERVVPALESMLLTSPLDDPERHEKVRERVYISLRELGPQARAAVPTLVKLAEIGDGSSEESMLARWALQEISPEAAARIKVQNPRRWPGSPPCPSPVR